MPQHVPVFNQSFECHKDIARLVAARIKPEITIRWVCSYKSDGPNGEPLAFIDIVPIHSKLPGFNKQELHQQIGIPPSSLVPEKVAPIAYWLVREFKKQRPDLFQAGEVCVI